MKKLKKGKDHVNNYCIITSVADPVPFFSNLDPTCEDMPF